MIRANNYETASKFVKDMPRNTILWVASFFGHGEGCTQGVS